MFLDLKAEIESLLNVKVYPLIGPQTESEFVTLQLVSDPPLESGTIRTKLVAGRWQICFISSLYSRTEEMDKKLWRTWEGLAQGHISSYPVQHIQRAGISESFDPGDGGKYRRTRDYIFYYPEDAS
ncbi:hypothetical protein [Buttiauxella agrestis]|uniref:hypothetical protein n=1 Tax=Buttiauxella agrestis TaxID=82977 RepID=UPI0039749A0B